MTAADELANVASVKKRNTVFQRPSNGSIQASPQVTGGIRLEALAGLVETATAKNPDTTPTAARTDLSSMGGGAEADLLSTAVVDAEAAPARWKASKTVDGGQPPILPVDSRSLVGLTMLLISYLRRGDTERLSYAKNIAPLMARTSFAAMFKSLPKPERAYLGSNAGDTFAQYVLFAAGLTGTEATPVFRYGLNYDNVANPQALDHLTRGLWLTNIATGKDLMTKKYIGAGAGSEMESLGALGSKKEKVAGGGKAPIFELRRMRQSVPANEWNALALRVYDFIVATNQGLGNVNPAY